MKELIIVDYQPDFVKVNPLADLVSRIIKTPVIAIMDTHNIEN